MQNIEGHRILRVEAVNVYQQANHDLWGGSLPRTTGIVYSSVVITESV